MPAYPLAPTPTLDAFIATAEEHGCTVEVLPVLGPRGLSEVRFLCRGDGPEDPFVPLPDIPGDQQLTRPVLRSLAMALGIPPAAFGYNLGWPPD